MSIYVKNLQNLGINNIDDAVTYLNKIADEMEEPTLSFKKVCDDLDGECSWWEIICKRKEQRRLRAEVLKRNNDTHFTELTDSFSHVVEFSPKLLIQYLQPHIEDYEENTYQLFEDVFVGKNESLNQMIRKYMVGHTNDERFLFKNYCDDGQGNYHLLLPTSFNGEEDHSTTGESISFPVLCLPSQKKVSVLDMSGHLTSEFKEFPYLEETMKKLVNYRIQHPELTQEQCLESLINEESPKEESPREESPKVYHI